MTSFGQDLHIETYRFAAQTDREKQKLVPETLVKAVRKNL